MLKQTKILIVLLAAFTLAAAAQTNTFPSSGNVGIGTTSPGGLLQVNGGAYTLNLGGSNLVPWASDMAEMNSHVTQVAFVDGRSVTALNSAQDGSGSCYQWGYSPYIPVDPNQDYEYSIWVQSNGQQNIYVGFFVYDSSETMITTGGLGNPYFHVTSENTNGGWERITAYLRASGTPANSDYTAVTTSNKSGPNTTDWVMPSNTAYAQLRFGSCYGGTGTSGRVYMYNPSVMAVAHDQLYGGVWSQFNGTGYNVGIGTASPGAKLEIDGNVKLTSGSGASITFPDSTVQSTAWTGTLTGGDYAESVDITGDRNSYEPGDVLVIDPSNSHRFLKAAEPYSLAVAGVYSTKPGVVGRRQKIDKALATTEVPMAMVGIVPTKVTTENGPIRRGDVLVSSSIAGYAMKATDRSLMAGAVIGKAMEPLDSGTGVIEALISLQ